MAISRSKIFFKNFFLIFVFRIQNSMIYVRHQKSCTLPLRRLYNWLRSTMGEERLANLARMHIPRARTMAIPTTKIVNMFNASRPRVLEFKIIEGQIVFRYVHEPWCLLVLGIHQYWTHCSLYETHRSFKNAISSIFLHWEHSLVCYYVLRMKKFESNAFLNVLCVLKNKQCVQNWWIPCI